MYFRYLPDNENSIPCGGLLEKKKFTSSLHRYLASADGASADRSDFF
jgi:hypothetical protein